MAEAALKTYGSLPKVFERPGQELRELLGLDQATTVLIAIARASLKHILSDNFVARKELSSCAALLDYLAFDLRHTDQEILRVIYLDTKCKIIKDEEMARGNVNAVPLYPREVSKKALIYCASSVILAHNHLSDDPTPSKADIQTTNQTKIALNHLGITLHDHVIISRGPYSSMKEAGYI